ncbi:MAG: dATP pyrophosphohydrolase [Alphaproteobacteria bacterium]
MAEPDSSVAVVPVESRAQRNDFLRLPLGLHAADPAYVPPLLMERSEALDERKNPYFRHAEVGFFLALRDGRPVGRISAQVNRVHLAKYADATGHFGLIEGEDEAVFRALTATAESWLGARGMRRVLGPFNLSINEETGLLVDGFATPPMVMMGHAPVSYGRFLEAAGYRKAKDLLAYAHDFDQPIPEAARRFIGRFGGRVAVRPLRRYRAEVAEALELYNAAWAGNWNSLPLGPEERAHLASSMRPLIDPALVQFADVDGRLAAFVVALPNLNAAIADLGGRLLPLGWLKLLWRLKIKGVTTARVLLMGVRPDLAGTPIGAAVAFLVIDALRRAALAKGYARAELSWILEDNMPMRRIIEAVGGRVYKTYRVYEKSLAP